jgi:hypothetical protein
MLFIKINQQKNMPFYFFEPMAYNSVFGSENQLP